MHPRLLLPLLLLAGLPTVLGCSSALVSTPLTSNAIAVSGNWQLSSASASRLPALSGQLSGTGTAITGLLHSSNASSCVAPDQVIAVSGAADKADAVTLAGSLAGGTLTITGTLAADGKSLSNAAFAVTGGTCAFARAALSTAQAFSPINGSYTGTFSDPAAPVLTLAATLTQTPASDTSGNFGLSGTAVFPANPCFNSPVSVSNSQVTGGSFTLTYADPVTANSVTASGTFSPDGTTLTVTNWLLTGSCGPDTGTGVLTRH